MVRRSGHTIDIFDEINGLEIDHVTIKIRIQSHLARTGLSPYNRSLHSAISYFLGMKTMEECWATFQPPNTHESIVGSWVACIYSKTKKEKRVDHFFIGRVKERFLLDEPTAENNYAVGLEIDCLVEKLGVGDCILSEHNDNVKDIDTFAVQNVISCGFKGVFQGGKKWSFPDYPKLKTLYEKVKKVDRQKMYQNYVQTKVIINKE